MLPLFTLFHNTFVTNKSIRTKITSNPTMTTACTILDHKRFVLELCFPYPEKREQFLIDTKDAKDCLDKIQDPNIETNGPTLHEIPHLLHHFTAVYNYNMSAGNDWFESTDFNLDGLSKVERIQYVVKHIACCYKFYNYHGLKLPADCFGMLEEAVQYVDDPFFSLFQAYMKETHNMDIVNLGNGRWHHEG
jgi:hypothetical protein